MRTSIARGWAGKPWLAAVLLGTFLVRALIPAGFMPAANGLAICHGIGAVQGGPFAHQSGTPGGGGSVPVHDGAGICPFAATAVAMAGHQAAVLPGLAPFAPPPEQVPSSVPVPRDIVVASRLPRGPPTTSV